MHEGLSITIKSVAVLVGSVMFILGALEIVMAVTGKDGTVLRGLLMLVPGAVIAGVPFLLAFRDMVQDARREDALVEALAREEGLEE